MADEDPTHGVRVGDVYRARNRPMTFTVTSVDTRTQLAHGRRSTSRRRQGIDLHNLAMANRYTLVQRGPEQADA